MSQRLRDFNILAGAQVGVHDVHSPKIPGSLNNTFIAQSTTDNKNTVYKLNHRDMAVKNAAVAKMLREHGVPAPDVTATQVGAQWFEVYPFIPGKTLYECVGDGMGGDEIDAVYAELAEMFYRTTKIDWRPIYNMKFSQTHHVARRNISDVNNPIVGTLFSGAVMMMNIGKAYNYGLCHCGITPKNVIIGPDGHVAALIDMDEVAIADKNYAFGMMAAKYYQLRGRMDNLVDHYELISGQSLNTAKVYTIANLTNMGKHIMWHMAHWRSKTK